MRSNRHLLRREWENVRADIERVVREQRIAPADFRPLGIHENWKAMEERIYQTFCQLTHPTARPLWLSNNLRQERETFAPDQPWNYLAKLIDPAEIVWFFTHDKHGKLWFYQGTVAAIVQVFTEAYYINELYIVSKKYEWLVGLEHHNVLIATGCLMPARLRQLKAAVD